MFRRMHLFWTVLALTTLMVASVAQAQRQGGGRGGRRGGPRFGGGFPTPNAIILSGNPAVQKELDMSSDQISQSRQLQQAYRNEARGQREQGGLDRDALQGLSREQRQARYQKYRETQAAVERKLQDKYTPKLAKVLKSEQIARLDQIKLQAAGAAAFRDAEVVKSLGLSKEQQDKLASIERTYRQKTRELFGRGGGGRRRRAAGGDGGGGDFRERFQQMRQLGQKRDEEANKVLIDEQRENFDQMKGEAFDVAQLRRGGGRRGGGQRPSRPRRRPPSE